MMPNPSSPIGIFDSGVGGLSVLSHIHQKLRNEDLIYVADSHFAPYGEKGETFVTERALYISRFFFKVPVKAIVVACNTATAAAVSVLRQHYSLPIIGIEPGVKPAVSMSRTGVIGVLATTETLKSKKFADLLAPFADHKIIAQKCPGLVEEIEIMNLEGPKLRELVTAYVAPLLAANVDTLVLGCTHYSFIAPLIQEIAGKEVTLIDTGEPVANELVRRLQQRNLLSTENRPGTQRFYTSASPAEVRPVFARLWGGEVNVFALP